MFVSYRRGDAAGWAQGLHDRLASRFGLDAVFIDVGGDIPPGTDFTDFITQRLRAVDVLLVVIGPGWVTAADESGESRLHDPDDLLRREIEVGLNIGLKVIPVLVAGAALPDESNVPADLRQLRRLQSFELRPTSYGPDLDRLVVEIEKLVPLPRSALAGWLRDHYLAAGMLGMGGVAALIVGLLVAGGVIPPESRSPLVAGTAITTSPVTTTTTVPLADSTTTLAPPSTSTTLPESSAATTTTAVRPATATPARPAPATTTTTEQEAPATTTAPLTVTRSGGGSGTVTSSPIGINCGTDCNHQFEVGTQVTLTAVPGPGSTFFGWQGACSGTSVCVVALNADQTATAIFASSSATLNVVVLGPGSVSISPLGVECTTSCSQQVETGTLLSLAAHPLLPPPYSGDRFVGWVGPCSGIGGCEFTIGQDVTVTAEFTSSTGAFTLTMLSPPDGGGFGRVDPVESAFDVVCPPGSCSYSFFEGTVVTLTGQPDPGFAFSGWSGGGCGSNSPCVITIGSDLLITPSFTPVGG